MHVVIIESGGIDVVRVANVYTINRDRVASDEVGTVVLAALTRPRV